MRIYTPSGLYPSFQTIHWKKCMYYYRIRRECTSSDCSLITSIAGLQMCTPFALLECAHLISRTFRFSIPALTPTMLQFRRQSQAMAIGQVRIRNVFTPQVPTRTAVAIPPTRDAHRSQARRSLFARTPRPTERAHRGNFRLAKRRPRVDTGPLDQ